MKKTITLLSIFLSILTSFQALGADRYSLNIKDFSEIDVIDGINVIHKCNSDSAGIVTFVSTDDIAHRILFSNNKNKLKIELVTDGAVIKNLPTITVYSSFLGKAENSGDSTLIVENPVPASSFKACITNNGTLIVHNVHATQVDAKIETGRGHIVIDGKASSVKLTNVGKGTLEAGNLKADEVSCIVLGTGPIDCYATEKLIVKGMGSNRIYVKGHPKEIVNRTIGAKIEQVE
ncbi:MAG: DUF2807 domain-containing protein [Muribaculaceae bacterium]|nr:DUF2807 domain-containing protein [Muribaculaceae bacterium]